MPVRTHVVSISVRCTCEGEAAGREDSYRVRERSWRCRGDAIAGETPCRHASMDLRPVCGQLKSEHPTEPQRQP